MHELLGPDTVQQISSVLNFEHTNNTTELTLTKLCCMLNVKLMLKHLINYLPMYFNSSLFGVTPHHLTQICKSTASLKTTHWFQCLHTGKLTDKCPRNCFPVKYDPLSLHLCTIYHLRSWKCRSQDPRVSGCQLSAARLWAAWPVLNAEADTPSSEHSHMLLLQLFNQTVGVLHMTLS